MNETIKTMLERRSVRKFTDEAVSKEKLDLIVDCAKASPTAKNAQLRQFTVITAASKIQKLAKAIGKEIDNSKYRMYNCPALIIVSTEESAKNGELDTACAIENIYLAAHSLGLGSVWINQLRGISFVPEIRTILDEFEIPKNHVVWGMSAIGVPAETPPLKERTEKVVYIK